MDESNIDLEDLYKSSQLSNSEHENFESFVDDQLNGVNHDFDVNDTITQEEEHSVFGGGESVVEEAARGEAARLETRKTTEARRVTFGMCEVHCSRSAFELAPTPDYPYHVGINGESREYLIDEMSEWGGSISTATGVLGGNRTSHEPSRISVQERDPAVFSVAIAGAGGAATSESSRRRTYSARTTAFPRLDENPPVASGGSNDSF